MATNQLRISSPDGTVEVAVIHVGELYALLTVHRQYETNTSTPVSASAHKAEDVGDEKVQQSPKQQHNHRCARCHDAAFHAVRLPDNSKLRKACAADAGRAALLCHVAETVRRRRGTGKIPAVSEITRCDEASECVDAVKDLAWECIASQSPLVAHCGPSTEAMEDGTDVQKGDGTPHNAASKIPCNFMLVGLKPGSLYAVVPLFPGANQDSGLEPFVLQTLPSAEFHRFLHVGESTAKLSWVLPPIPRHAFFARETGSLPNNTSPEGNCGGVLCAVGSPHQEAFEITLSVGNNLVRRAVLNENRTTFEELHGATFYTFRVRSKDKRGSWGTWGELFRFTTLPKFRLRCISRKEESLKILWQRVVPKSLQVMLDAARTDISSQIRADSVSEFILTVKESVADAAHEIFAAPAKVRTFTEVPEQAVEIVGLASGTTFALTLEYRSPFETHTATTEATTLRKTLRTGKSFKLSKAMSVRYGLKENAVVDQEAFIKQAASFRVSLKSFCGKKKVMELNDLKPKEEESSRRSSGEIGVVGDTPLSVAGRSGLRGEEEDMIPSPFNESTFTPESAAARAGKPSRPLYHPSDDNRGQHDAAAMSTSGDSSGLSPGGSMPQDAGATTTGEQAAGAEQKTEQKKPESNPCKELTVTELTNSTLSMQLHGDKDTSTKRSRRKKEVWIRLFCMDPAKEEPPPEFGEEDANEKSQQAKAAARGKVGAAADILTPNSPGSVGAPTPSKDRARNVDRMDVTRVKDIHLMTGNDKVVLNGLKHNTRYIVKATMFNVGKNQWYPFTPTIDVKTLRTPELFIVRVEVDKVLLRLDTFAPKPTEKDDTAEKLPSALVPSLSSAMLKPGKKPKKSVRIVDGGEVEDDEKDSKAAATTDPLVVDELAWSLSSKGTPTKAGEEEELSTTESHHQHASNTSPTSAQGTIPTTTQTTPGTTGKGDGDGMEAVVDSEHPIPSLNVSEGGVTKEEVEEEGDKADVLETASVASSEALSETQSEPPCWRGRIILSRLETSIEEELDVVGDENGVFEVGGLVACGRYKITAQAIYSTRKKEKDSADAEQEVTKKIIDGRRKKGKKKAEEIEGVNEEEETSDWSLPMFLVCAACHLSIGSVEMESFTVKWYPNVATEIKKTTLDAWFLSVSSMASVLPIVKQLNPMEVKDGGYRMADMPSDRYRVSLIHICAVRTQEEWEASSKTFFRSRYVTVSLARWYTPVVFSVGESYVAFFCSSDIHARLVLPSDRILYINSLSMAEEHTMMACLHSVASELSKDASEQFGTGDVEYFEVEITLILSGNVRTMTRRIKPNAAMAVLVEGLRGGTPHRVKIRPRITYAQESFYGYWSHAIEFSTLGTLKLVCCEAETSHAVIRWVRQAALDEGDFQPPVLYHEDTVSMQKIIDSGGWSEAQERVLERRQSNARSTGRKAYNPNLHPKDETALDRLMDFAIRLSDSVLEFHSERAQAEVDLTTWKKKLEYMEELVQQTKMSTEEVERDLEEAREMVEYQKGVLAAPMPSYLDLVTSNDSPCVLFVQQMGSPTIYAHATEPMAYSLRLTELENAGRYLCRVKQDAVLGTHHSFSNAVLVETEADVVAEIQRVGEDYITLVLVRNEHELGEFNMYDDLGEAVAIERPDTKSEIDHCQVFLQKLKSAKDDFTIRSIPTIQVGTIFSLPELQSDTEYVMSIRLKYRNATYWSPWSPRRAFKTMPPISIEVLKVTETAVSIAWKRNETTVVCIDDEQQYTGIKRKQ